MKKTGLLLSSLLLAGLVLAQGELVVKSYPVYTSDPVTIVNTIKDVLGDKVKIAYFKPNNQIIVTAAAQEQDVAAALIKEMNVPTRNIRIDVNMGDETVSSETGASLGASGKVVVSRKGTSYNVKLDPEIKAQSGTSTSNTRQTLMVQSGMEGTIFVGQEIPYAEWIIQFVRTGRYIEQNYEMRPVGASLVVIPQIVGGGMLSISIVPEISAQVEGHLERIRITRVATQVTMADGATITLGGFGDNKEFYDKFLIGFNERGERRSMNITLTAKIQGVPGQDGAAGTAE